MRIECKRFDREIGEIDNRYSSSMLIRLLNIHSHSSIIYTYTHNTDIIHIYMKLPGFFSSVVTSNRPTSKFVSLVSFYV